MKKIYIEADSFLNLTNYEQNKISLGDTAVLELKSSVNNEYSLRVDFNLPREVPYLRHMELKSENFWTYELPNIVVSAVSSKNKAVTLEGYITASNVINNTINENDGYTNKLGNYTVPSELPVGDVGVDYAVVAFEEDGITENSKIWQYTATDWVDSGLKEKLTNVATTTINIQLDKFVQNSQELVDATITDNVLDNLSNLNVLSQSNEAKIGVVETKLDQAEVDIDNLESGKVDKDLPYTTATLDNEQELYIYDAGTALKATMRQIENFVTRNIIGLTMTKLASKAELDALTPSEIKSNKLYLIPLPEALEDNVYAEYYYDFDTSKWELYGTTRVSLLAEDIKYNDSNVFEEITGLKGVQETITLLQSNWVVDATYGFKYTYSNASITADRTVDFVVDKASQIDWLDALPYAETNSISGAVEFYTTNQPTVDIIGTLKIKEVS